MLKRKSDLTRALWITHAKLIPGVAQLDSDLDEEGASVPATWRKRASVHLHVISEEELAVLEAVVSAETVGMLQVRAERQGSYLLKIASKV